MVSAGQDLFRPGDSCSHFIVLCEGVVRVDVLGPQGKEIMLYRLERGDSCVVTTAALLGGTPYFASAQAETAARIVRIPAQIFERLLAESVGFRNHVFASQGRRIVDLAAAVGIMANERIDHRLAHRLLQLCDSGSGHGARVQITHEALARDIGTAREVVSRNLAVFSRRGWVTLQRGVILVRDQAALRGLQQGS